MNIYRGVRIPESLQTPENLLHKASEFANILAAGRWHQKNIQKVEITRSIAEEIGAEYELGDEFVDSIYTEMMISFSAYKQITDNQDGTEFIAPNYAVTSTTSQEITKNEVPRVVLDEIFSDTKDDEHPIHDLLEMEGLDEDNLDELEIRRIQQDEYEINHLGELQDYATAYSYTFDDVQVHEVGYRHSNDVVLYRPVNMYDATRVEGQPFSLTALNEIAIKIETQDIDASYEKYLDSEFLRSATEFGGLSRQEHTRRVLGMIAMVSNGFVNLRKPTSRR